MHHDLVKSVQQLYEVGRYHYYYSVLQMGKLRKPREAEWLAQSQSRDRSLGLSA